MRNIDDDFVDRWLSKLLNEFGIAYGDFKGGPVGLRAQEIMRSSITIAMARYAPHEDPRIQIGATNV